MEDHSWRCGDSLVEMYGIGARADVVVLSGKMWLLSGSVADPYNFDTDLDPGCEKIRYGSGSRVNFDVDPDPGKNYTDP